MEQIKLTQRQTKYRNIITKFSKSRFKKERKVNVNCGNYSITIISVVTQIEELQKKGFSIKSDLISIMIHSVRDENAMIKLSLGTVDNVRSSQVNFFIIDKRILR
ncbi:Hypothetical_protein [Hexamita inflata]|uniref:Hypothetical_protein n=1 Tax=Hexamita inflata TaxID=28002 RepID=A0AA86U8K8_9EUKA|nr:Hypothetical protein HINF_LOCUS35175 [Hexamita inflata]